MPTVLVNGKLQVLGDNHCFICNGTLKESETECPVCKARAYEAQLLKQRLELVQSCLQERKQNQND
jgi:uncharacterized paraquat-inducible protein A